MAVPVLSALQTSDVMSASRVGTRRAVCNRLIESAHVSIVLWATGPLGATFIEGVPGIGIAAARRKAASTVRATTCWMARICHRGGAHDTVVGHAYCNSMGRV